MMRLLSELQRRHVIRVAAGYVVAGSIILQAAGALENALTLPGWFDTFVFSILIIGFPLAVAASWMFELTPEGLKRTVTSGDVPLMKPQTADWLLIGALVVVAGVAVVQSTMPRGGELTMGEKSIAVLPFANLSSDKDDYGGWLAELIRGILGKVNDLKVSSQTSSSAFKDKGIALPEIAKQLGVSLVLEGSVRHDGDDIVISAQLIHAATDGHIWTETYERKADNVLSVQSEVAKAIATAVAKKLKVALSESEQRALKPTNSAEAYEAYQHASRLYRISGEANLRSAQGLLEQAVELDPSFALAWALLARCHAYLFFNRTDATEGRRAAASEALNNALRLEPELADVLLAEAYYRYWVERDYEGARRRFEQLSAKWPSNSDIAAALANIARRQGRWAQSKFYFDRTVALDPLYPSRWLAAAELRIATREFPDALRLLDDALSRWHDLSDSLPFIFKKAQVYQALGRLNDADTLLKGLHPQPTDEVVEAMVYQAVLRRRHDETISLLQQLLERDEAGGSVGRASIDLNIYLGNLRRLAGDAAGAKGNYIEARDELIMELKKQPDSPDIHSYLALVSCGLGDRRAATKYAALAVNAVPVSKDALSGAYYEDTQARIWARLGDRTHAIPAIEKLMKLPAPLPLTPAILRLDPDFDKLRGDPRFEALLSDASGL